MSYLGRGLDKISNIEILDNITFDGSSSYSITKGSVAFIPNSAQSLLISIDGVVQATNFTVSSSTIDFGVAIPSTSVCNFFLHYGTGVMTVPSDGSVTTAKLGNSAVDLTSKVTGALPVANGGTGVTTAAALANTGNLVKLHQITVSSGDADVVFDSTYLTTDYDIYKIYLKNVRPVTDATRLLARFSYDNGSTYESSNYSKVSFEAHQGTASDVINSRYASAAGSMNINGSSSTQGNAVDESTSGVIEFFNSAVDYKRLQTFLTWHFSGNQTATAQTSHEHKANRTTRVNAIKFFQNSGNMESGIFTLYGVKDA